MFSQGPCVAAHIVDDFNGWKIRLTNSSSFSLSVSANIPLSLVQEIQAWMESYSQKSPLPVDFLPRQILPPFTQIVIETLSQLPFGEVISYSQLAEKSGSPRASRAVGNICHNNRFPLLVPCHRVIHQSGKSGGFAFDLSIKERLIEFESSFLLS